MPYDSTEEPDTLRRTVDRYATITHVQRTGAFAVTALGEYVFVAGTIVKAVQPAVGAQYFMRCSKNENPRGKRPCNLFACFVQPAAGHLPPGCDLPNDNGAVYFYREPDGEWAWGDEPPQPGEEAYVFRFERVEGA